MGGKATPVSGHPVDAHVVIRASTDDLVIPFEQSRVSMGPAAAVTIGQLDIVLATGRAQTFSPEAFTNLGIDLAGKKIVVVKSSNHFYAAFSKIAYPEMRRYGYERKFSLGCIAGSACLGMLIPPSVLMIVWGVLTELAIGKLFIAGIIPGFIVVTFYIAYIVWVAKTQPHRVGEGVTLPQAQQDAQRE